MEVYIYCNTTVVETVLILLSEREGDTILNVDNFAVLVECWKKGETANQQPSDRSFCSLYFTGWVSSIFVSCWFASGRIIVRNMLKNTKEKQNTTQRKH